MEFRKPFESYDSPVTSSGSTKRPVYTLENKNGERSLKKVRDIDIPSYINSFEAETDIKAILKRYSLTGDTRLLNMTGGLYVDVTNVENDYARLLAASREIALLDLQSLTDQQALSVAEAESAVADSAESCGEDPAGTVSDGV